jgi:hypothetical protein
MLGIFALAAFFGLIPAIIAHDKGHSFFVWWIYGTLLIVVALPHAIVLKPEFTQIRRSEPEGALKQCGTCEELTNKELIKCHYCGVLRPR